MILRNFGEWILRAAALYEQQIATVPEVRVFDTSSMPIDPKNSYGLRDPASVRLVVTHVTDVTGGFGVSRKAVAAWTQRLEAGKVPHELAIQLPEDDLEESARLLALWERYSRKGYHWIASATFDAIRNHPVRLRTVHGNSGNRGVGWAIDVGHKQQLTERHVSSGRVSLRLCLEDAHRDNGGQGLVVAPHRCFSASRRLDTNRAVHELITVPVVDALPFASFDYELCEGGGRPIANDWDPRARYDLRGRKVA